jgi:hypothetical protein
MQGFTTITDLAAELNITPEALREAAATDLYEALAPEDQDGRLWQHEVASTPLDRIRISRLSAACLDRPAAKLPFPHQTSRLDHGNFGQPKHRRHVLTAYSLEPLEAVTDEYLAACAARSANGRGAEHDWDAYADYAASDEYAAVVRDRIAAGDDDF